MFLIGLPLAALAGSTVCDSEPGTFLRHHFITNVNSPACAEEGAIQGTNPFSGATSVRCGARFLGIAENTTVYIYDKGTINVTEGQGAGANPLTAVAQASAAGSYCILTANPDAETACPLPAGIAPSAEALNGQGVAYCEGIDEDVATGTLIVRTLKSRRSCVPQCTTGFRPVAGGVRPAQLWCRQGVLTPATFTCEPSSRAPGVPVAIAEAAPPPQCWTGFTSIFIERCAPPEACDCRGGYCKKCCKLEGSMCRFHEPMGWHVGAQPACRRCQPGQGTLDWVAAGGCGTYAIGTATAAGECTVSTPAGGCLTYPSHPCTQAEPRVMARIALPPLPQKYIVPNWNSVTPQNQGQCGSCYAFAAAHVYASVANVAQVSMQRHLSCNNFDQGGCGGGQVLTTLKDWVHQQAPPTCTGDANSPCSAGCQRYFAGSLPAPCSPGYSASTNKVPVQCRQAGRCGPELCDVCVGFDKATSSCLTEAKKPGADPPFSPCSDRCADNTTALTRVPPGQGWVAEGVATRFYAAPASGNDNDGAFVYIGHRIVTRMMMRDTFTHGPLGVAFHVFSNFGAEEYDAKASMAIQFGVRTGAHATASFGWDLTIHTPAWTHLNSWGASWGDKGWYYFKMGAGLFEDWPGGYWLIKRPKPCAAEVTFSLSGVPANAARVVVRGQGAALGDNSVDGPALAKSGSTWLGYAELPCGADIQYTYVVDGTAETITRTGGMRVRSVGATGGAVQADDTLNTCFETAATKFSLKNVQSFTAGDSVFVCGDIAPLGNNVEANCAPMTRVGETSDFEATINLPVVARCSYPTATVINFRFARRPAAGGALEFEGVANPRSTQAPIATGAVTLPDYTWGQLIAPRNRVAAEQNCQVYLRFSLEGLTGATETDHVYVVGNHPALGDGEPTAGVRLSLNGTSGAQSWNSSAVAVPCGVTLHYRYARWTGLTSFPGQGAYEVIEQQAGARHVYTTPDFSTNAHVRDMWAECPTGASSVSFTRFLVRAVPAKAGDVVKLCGSVRALGAFTDANCVDMYPIIDTDFAAGVDLPTSRRCMFPNNTIEYTYKLNGVAEPLASGRRWLAVAPNHESVTLKPDFWGSSEPPALCGNCGHVVPLCNLAGTGLGVTGTSANNVTVNGQQVGAPLQVLRGVIATLTQGVMQSEAQFEGAREVTCLSLLLNLVCTGLTDLCAAPGVVVPPCKRMCLDVVDACGAPVLEFFKSSLVPAATQVAGYDATMSAFPWFSLAKVLDCDSDRFVDGGDAPEDIGTVCHVGSLRRVERATVSEDCADGSPAPRMPGGRRPRGPEDTSAASEGEIDGEFEFMDNDPYADNAPDSAGGAEQIPQDSDLDKAFGALAAAELGSEVNDKCSEVSVTNFLPEGGDFTQIVSTRLSCPEDDEASFAESRARRLRALELGEDLGEEPPHDQPWRHERRMMAQNTRTLGGSSRVRLNRKLARRLTSVRGARTRTSLLTTLGVTALNTTAEPAKVFTVAKSVTEVRLFCDNVCQCPAGGVVPSRDPGTSLRCTCNATRAECPTAPVGFISHNVSIVGCKAGDTACCNVAWNDLCRVGLGPADTVMGCGCNGTVGYTCPSNCSSIQHAGFEIAPAATPALSPQCAALLTRGTRPNTPPHVWAHPNLTWMSLNLTRTPPILPVIRGRCVEDRSVLPPRYRGVLVLAGCPAGDSACCDAAWHAALRGPLADVDALRTVSCACPGVKGYQCPSRGLGVPCSGACWTQLGPVCANVGRQLNIGVSAFTAAGRPMSMMDWAMTRQMLVELPIELPTLPRFHGVINALQAPETAAVAGSLVSPNCTASVLRQLSHAMCVLSVVPCSAPTMQPMRPCRALLDSFSACSSLVNVLPAALRPSFSQVFNASNYVAENTNCLRLDTPATTALTAPCMHEIRPPSRCVRPRSFVRDCVDTAAVPVTSPPPPPLASSPPPPPPVAAPPGFFRDPDAYAVTPPRDHWLPCPRALVRAPPGSGLRFELVQLVCRANSTSGQAGRCTRLPLATGFRCTLNAECASGSCLRTETDPWNRCVAVNSPPPPPPVNSPPPPPPVGAPPPGPCAACTPEQFCNMTVANQPNPCVARRGPAQLCRPVRFNNREVLTATQTCQAGLVCYIPPGQGIGQCIHPVTGRLPPLAVCHTNVINVTGPSTRRRFLAEVAGEPTGPQDLLSTLATNFPGLPLCGNGLQCVFASETAVTGLCLPLVAAIANTTVDPMFCPDGFTYYKGRCLHPDTLPLCADSAELGADARAGCMCTCGNNSFNGRCAGERRRWGGLRRRVLQLSEDLARWWVENGAAYQRVPPLGMGGSDQAVWSALGGLRQRAQNASIAVMCGEMYELTGGREAMHQAPIFELADGLTCADFALSGSVVAVPVPVQAASSRMAMDLADTFRQRVVLARTRQEAVAAAEAISPRDRAVRMAFAGNFSDAEQRRGLLEQIAALMLSQVQEFVRDQCQVIFTAGSIVATLVIPADAAGSEAAAAEIATRATEGLSSSATTTAIRELAAAARFETLTVTQGAVATTANETLLSVATTVFPPPPPPPGPRAATPVGPPTAAPVPVAAPDQDECSNGWYPMTKKCADFQWYGLGFPRSEVANQTAFRAKIDMYDGVFAGLSNYAAILSASAPQCSITFITQLTCMVGFARCDSLCKTQTVKPCKSVCTEFNDKCGPVISLAAAAVPAIDFNLWKNCNGPMYEQGTVDPCHGLPKLDRDETNKVANKFPEKACAASPPPPPPPAFSPPPPPPPRAPVPVAVPPITIVPRAVVPIAPIAGSVAPPMSAEDARAFLKAQNSVVLNIRLAVLFSTLTDTVRARFASSILSYIPLPEVRSRCVVTFYPGSTVAATSVPTSGGTMSEENAMALATQVRADINTNIAQFATMMGLNASDIAVDAPVRSRDISTSAAAPAPSGSDPALFALLALLIIPIAAIVGILVWFFVLRKKGPDVQPEQKEGYQSQA